MNDFFRVGVVTTAHGIKGALRVFPTTDDPARFKDLRTLIYCRGENYSADPAEQRILTVRDVAFSKGQVLLGVDEISDRNEAELLRGGSLWVSREEAVELAEDEFYISDFIGAPVVSDAGEELGRIDDILQIASNEVLVVKSAKEELLIPVIRDCIVSMDAQKPLVTVHVLPGIRE